MILSSFLAQFFSGGGKLNIFNQFLRILDLLRGEVVIHSFTITRLIPCAQFFLRILGEATMKIYFLLYKLTQNLQLGIIDRYQWGHVHISHCYVDGMIIFVNAFENNFPCSEVSCVVTILYYQ